MLVQGYAAIPKSTHRNRIIENTGVFGWTLSEDEVKELDGLNECEWRVCFLVCCVFLLTKMAALHTHSPAYRLGCDGCRMSARMLIAFQLPLHFLLIDADLNS